MARTSHAIGTFTMVLAMVWMAAMLRRSYRMGKSSRAAGFRQRAA